MVISHKTLSRCVIAISHQFLFFISGKILGTILLSHQFYISGEIWDTTLLSNQFFILDETQGTTSLNHCSLLKLKFKALPC